MQEHVSLPLLFLSILLSCFVTLFAYRNGFYRFPEPLQHTKISIWHVLGAFLTFLSTMVVLVPILSWAILSWHAGHILNPQQLSIDTLTQSKLNVMAIILSFLTLIGYCFLMPKSNREAVLGASFVEKKHLWTDFVLGLITWCISYPIVIAVNQLIRFVAMLSGHIETPLEQVAVRYLKATLDTPILFILTAFLIICVVPIIEEILFRGFLQTWIRQKCGRKKAIFITSLIFSIFHFSRSQGFENAEFLIALFLLSCFLGFLYERQRSLLASISLHGVFNAVSVLVLFFS